MGDLFKNSKNRGVYKSNDGGETWKKVLYIPSNNTSDSKDYVDKL